MGGESTLRGRGSNDTFAPISDPRSAAAVFSIEAEAQMKPEFCGSALRFGCILAIRAQVTTRQIPAQSAIHDLRYEVGRRMRRSTLCSPVPTLY